MSLPATFLAKTNPQPDCIIWTGAQNNRGYGCYAVNGVSQLAHRVAWEAAHGPIPDGLTIDHLCRVRCCVNVEHMEVVSIGENTSRARKLRIGGECALGHRIASKADLYVRPGRGAECRACRKAYADKRKADAARPGLLDSA